jgi:hypothetical protein
MGTVIVDLSTALDGFVAGADDGLELPLGRGGEQLFTWRGAGPEANRIEARLQLGGGVRLFEALGASVSASEEANART